MTLVIEKGAGIYSPELWKQFINKGIDVICQPGSTLLETEYDPNVPEVVISETTIWRNPLSQFDYLGGVPALFVEELGSSLPSLGGRATSTPGLRRPERVLKGFGGCRFFHKHGTYSMSSPNQVPRVCICRWKNGHWGPPGKKSCEAWCSGYVHLVIKKRGRATKTGLWIRERR